MMNSVYRQCLECSNDQRITRQNSNSFSKFSVQRWLATALSGVVETRQIVVDQRIDVHRLDCDGSAQGLRAVSAVHRSSRSQQQRAQPLAPAGNQVAGQFWNQRHW